jgi:hypothetical protein
VCNACGGVTVHAKNVASSTYADALAHRMFFCFAVQVMAHLFFNPMHGKMREHAAVETIRALLQDKTAGPRPCKRVMIRCVIRSFVVKPEPGKIDQEQMCLSASC